MSFVSEAHGAQIVMSVRWASLMNIMKNTMAHSLSVFLLYIKAIYRQIYIYIYICVHVSSSFWGLNCVQNVPLRTACVPRIFNKNKKKKRLKKQVVLRLLLPWNVGCWFCVSSSHSIANALNQRKTTIIWFSYNRYSMRIYRYRMHSVSWFVFLFHGAANYSENSIQVNFYFFFLHTI